MSDIPRVKIDTDAEIEFIRLINRSTPIDNANAVDHANLGIANDLLTWRKDTGASLTAVEIDATQTLTNKSISANQITAGTFAAGAYVFQHATATGIPVTVKSTDDDTTNPIISVTNNAGTIYNAVVTADGKFGLNITSLPSAQVQLITPTAVTTSFQIQKESDSIRYLMETYSDTATHFPQLNLRHARGSIASPTTTVDGDSLGSINFVGYDATTPGPAFQLAAQIIAKADGEWGTSGDTSDTPGRLEFYTVPDGAQSASLRMTIKNDGKIGIGIAAPTGFTHIDQASATGAVPVLTIDQADVSEEFVRLVGTSANGVLTQSIVDAADVVLATVAGYVKIFIQDDGNQLADQAYFLAAYTLT